MRSGGSPSLSDEALDQVRAGAIEPRMAAEIGAMVPNPEEHASYVSLLQDSRPNSVAQARQVISDEMQSRSFPEAAQSLLGRDAAVAPELNAARDLTEPALPARRRPMQRRRLRR